MHLTEQTIEANAVSSPIFQAPAFVSVNIATIAAMMLTHKL